MKTNLFFLAMLISGILSAQDIRFSAWQLYPEGIAYSESQDVFFVSSLYHGKIGKVDRKGSYTEFVDSPELISSIGLRLDDKKNILYVCVSDPGVSVKTSADTRKKVAKVIAYDSRTGLQKYTADLGALNPVGSNFANDIALDNNGNIYVTNSFSPIIYKVDPDGNASVFSTSDLWKGNAFSLNGIVYHPGGYLIVARSDPGELYKVSLENPKEITLIDADPIPGADGLLYDPKSKELLVISNAGAEIYRLKGKKNWKSASRTGSVKSKLAFPTTATMVGKKYYVLNAKLSELFNPSATKTSDFVIQEVVFD